MWRTKRLDSWKIMKIGPVIWQCSALACGETERVAILRKSAIIRKKSAAHRNRAGKWLAVFRSGKNAAICFFVDAENPRKSAFGRPPPKRNPATKFHWKIRQKNPKIRFLHRLRVYSTYVRKRCRIGFLTNRDLESGFSGRIFSDF